MRGRTEIVRNFLIETLAMQQNHAREMDCFAPGPGLMPASFKVEHDGEKEFIEADFGEDALAKLTEGIARVPPVDSCLWWILLLRAYVKATGDIALAHQSDFQTGMKLILDLCLVHRFSMYPTLPVLDGSFTIDRRMGVGGHPLEIQVLFYAALRTVKELLLPQNGGDLGERPDLASPDRYLQSVNQRLGALRYHIREYYWLDLKRLNEIYRFKNDRFGQEVANKFNIYPESIPAWLTEWLPENGGYLVGNLAPGHMDFRFFALGNLMAILVSPASSEESQSIMNLFEERSLDLIGFMPLKICFPAVEGGEWRIVTGSDPKNIPWSYHNGGNWPTILWLFAAAAQKTGRQELASRAIALAAPRLIEDRFPEYYDGKQGRLIGKSARVYQTWTIAGLLAAKEIMNHPKHIDLLNFEEEIESPGCRVW